MLSSECNDASEGLSRQHRYPFLQTVRSTARSGYKDLGITPLARQLGLTPEQTNGHWCSRCEGIWFGYTLETQCPVCGNRKG